MVAINKKVGKRRLNELNNPVVFDIIKELSFGADNSAGIAERLGKNQSGIYFQFNGRDNGNGKNKGLIENKYLIPSDVKKNAYQVNYNKLLEEFIKHCNNKHIWILDETLYFNNMLNKCIISKEFKTLKEVFEFIDNYLYYKNKMQEFLKK